MRLVSILLAGIASATLVACASGGGCPATCGGKARHGFVPREAAPAPAPAPVPASAPAAPAPAAPAAHGEHHGAMPPEVHRFHEILAPRWHAPEGAQRTADTCAAIPDFRTGASAIAKTSAGPDAAAWTAAATDLAARVEDLAATCTTPPAATFEPAFSALHDAFHRVADLALKKP
jgi:hypothetical protein